MTLLLHGLLRGGLVHHFHLQLAPLRFLGAGCRSLVRCGPTLSSSHSNVQSDLIGLDLTSTALQPQPSLANEVVRFLICDSQNH